MRSYLQPVDVYKRQGLNGGSHKLGSLTLPMSSGNTERQIQFMCDLGSTILCCTPSYAAYLGETICEMGLQDKIKLKAGIFGAEAWSEEMRHDIQKKLNIKAYDIYGLTEITGPGVSFECSEQTGMHINEDHFIAEIIDPKTGEVLPDVYKRQIVHRNGKITSAGDTVLGADDLAGVAAILEALEEIKEYKLPHREMEIVFTFSEEPYLQGSRHLEYSRCV